MTPIMLFTAPPSPVIVFMTAIFFVALFSKDNSIVDIAWGAGFVFVWAVTFVLRSGWTPLQVSAGAMTPLGGQTFPAHLFPEQGTRRGHPLRPVAPSSGRAYS